MRILDQNILVTHIVLSESVQGGGEDFLGGEVVQVEDFLGGDDKERLVQEGQASSKLKSSSQLRPRSVLHKSTKRQSRLSVASQRFASILATSGWDRSERNRLIPSNELLKPKVLALHGKKSNNAVTKLQLENLGITEDKYDIFYLSGLIEEAKGDPTVLEFFNGPFFSWYHDKTDGRFKSSFIEAISNVYKEILAIGPIDMIYGFSQGATIAAAVAAAYSDSSFRKIILEPENSRGQSMKKSISRTQNKKSLKARASMMMSFNLKASRLQPNLSAENFYEA